MVLVSGKNRALRTETTINKPRDFQVGKVPANWPYLHKLETLINVIAAPAAGR